MHTTLRALGPSLTFFFGILVVTGILAAFSAGTAMVFAIAAMGASFVTICKPIRALGLGRRGVSATALCAAVLAAAMTQHGLTRERCTSDNARSLAYINFQDHVGTRLTAPSAAKFPSSTEVKVMASGDCSFEIVGYLDAHNVFGAMIRSHYVARMTRHKQADNGWRLDLVDFL